MANYNRGRPRFSDRGSRGPTEMHRAICDKCKKECEVPFRPTSGKPVFCSNCFDRNPGFESRGFEDRPSLRSEDSRPMYDAVCDDCGSSCKVPFQPRGDKPIFCSNCFGQKKGAGNRENGQAQPQYKDQFEALNHKLDKILLLLDSKSNPDQQSQEQVIIAEIETKPVKKRSAKPRTTLH